MDIINMHYITLEFPWQRSHYFLFCSTFLSSCTQKKSHISDRSESENIRMEQYGENKKSDRP